MEEPRHELAALIDRVRDANGWSDTDITRRATAEGHKLGKSNLSRIRNTDVVSITASTIRGLAAGLAIPESEVAQAALVSMGIDLPQFGEIDLETAVRLDADLSVRDKSMLLDLLRGMRQPGETARHRPIGAVRYHKVTAEELDAAVARALEHMGVAHARLPSHSQPPYNPEAAQLAEETESDLHVDHSAGRPDAAPLEQPPFDRSRLLAAMSEPDQEDRAGKSRRSRRSKVDLEQREHELPEDDDFHEQ
ncbi:hypothetical protein [Nocardia cyriacigeorgica]|uniref:Uncharacterized protein n=1 Tax=Nocardia cyriacigeorgica TaxID=135487 RepID=A0A5R8NAZ7_9NOCA|nr:hypothetical protein [Nocardia cyriacigeorgica]TLF72881.1 hypothetical protein FEK34_28060 [Nocardia cyriacigeorgica]